MQAKSIHANVVFSLGESEDYYDPVTMDLPPCTASYETLDDMVKVTPNIPTHCVDLYLMRVESKLLDKAVKSYTDAINNGYDAKFKVYEQHIKELVPIQLKFWMRGAEASGFFSCTTTGYRSCCRQCTTGCAPTCVKGDTCVPGIMTIKTKCPENIPDSWDPNPVDQITYTLTNADGFYAVILKEYGIAKSWIKFERLKVRVPASCWQGPVDCGEKMSIYFDNFPWPR